MKYAELSHPESRLGRAYIRMPCGHTWILLMNHRVDLHGEL
jgi:hypothetical protein